MGDIFKKHGNHVETYIKKKQFCIKSITILSTFYRWKYELLLLLYYNHDDRIVYIAGGSCSCTSSN